jgi:hypothetical protein
MLWFNMAESAAILAVSSQHSFFGTIENRGLRVLEVLNDLSTDYLDLHDVAVFRGLHGECLKRLRSATIPKSAIDFVLLESHRHEAALRRTHAYVPKEARSAFVVLGEFEFHGTLMLKWSSETIRTVQQSKTAFFPVTNPKLLRLNNDEQPITAGTALINGLKITLLDFDRAATGAAL